MTKVERLAKLLRERITKGEWPADSRLPSREKLAKEYDLSPATVSIVIRQLEKEGLLYILSSKGAFVAAPGEKRASKANVGYTIGLKGRNLPTARKLAGFLRSPEARESILEGVWEAADASGCNLVLLNSEVRKTPLDYRRSMGVDGIIYMSGHMHQEALELRLSGFPVFLMNQPVGPTPLNYLDYDNAGALRSMVARFAALGHRRIAVITWQTSVPSYFPTMKTAFLEALHAEGLIYHVDPYWRFFVPIPNEEDFARQTRAEAEALLSLPEPPTAIFCWLEGMAKEVRQCAHGRGLAVPEDLSIACSNLLQNGGEFSGFSIPYKELGERLLHGMIETIHNPFYSLQSLVPLTSIEGKSVGPAPC